MASPQIIVFALFDSSAAPLTGQSPTFATYKKNDGSDIVSQPAITEIGGGFYKFTPDLAAATTGNYGIAYMIDGGAPAVPRYQYDFLRPEDFNIDLIKVMSQVLKNRWKIVSNQLLVYADDGTTVILTFNLFDQTHTPTMTQIFERAPV